MCAMLLGSIFCGLSPTETYTCTLWMALHGAKSSKPTVVYSNMPEVQGFHVGRLTKSEKERRTSVKTTRALHYASFPRRFGIRSVQKQSWENPVSRHCSLIQHTAPWHSRKGQ